MIATIRNLNDVENFATLLISEGVNFHPDDDFLDYVSTETRNPFFSIDEAQRRNILMKKCFEICFQKGVDIYDFMNEILLKETGMDTFIPLPSMNIQE